MLASRKMSTTPGRSSSSSSRLPRWTLHEILVLVEAKQAFEKQLKATVRSPSNKWVFVSSYCRARGVERGPLQCRKRWSNLACDFKKIKAWEANIKKKDKDGNDSKESYWVMRSDVRRGKKMAGNFDREVFEIMELEIGEEMKELEDDDDDDDDDDDEGKVFDSGRKGKDQDGLFEEEVEEGEEEEGEMIRPMLPLAVVPISERKYSPEIEQSEPGNSNGKQQTDNNYPEKDSSSWERQKRQKKSDKEVTASFEDKLIDVLERNNRILYAQLEAHNLNYQLDREQMKDQADGIVNIMAKLANTLERIADKLEQSREISNLN